MQVGRGAGGLPGGGVSHRIRRNSLWCVREKGVKACKYDSVHGVERGNSRNFAELCFGDAGCGVLSGDAS